MRFSKKKNTGFTDEKHEADDDPPPSPFPCVCSKRPRVYRHHAHTCLNMCAWCRYTRGRFERTHGGFSSVSHHTPHTPQHKTQDTTHNTRRQKREKRRRQRRDKTRQVVLTSCFFMFKITRPSNIFEFSKLPLPNLKALFSR